MAATKVASVPKMMSKILPVMRFATRHPTVSPGMAAGVKKGRIVKTSETRNWIMPKENAPKTKVRAAYSAPMTAAYRRKRVCALRLVFDRFMFFSCEATAPAQAPLVLF